MDKRLLLAVVVSMAILFLWMKIHPPIPQTPQAPTPVANSSLPASGSGVSVPTPAQAQTDSTAKAATPPNERPAETLVTLESPEANYVFSSLGRLASPGIKLKDRQFLLNPAQPDSGMQIVSTSKEDTAPFAHDVHQGRLYLERQHRLVGQSAGGRHPGLSRRNRRRGGRETLHPRSAALPPAARGDRQNKSGKPLDHGLAVRLFAAQILRKRVAECSATPRRT